MATLEYPQAINQHYGSQDLGSAILAGLQAEGKDLETLSYEDLTSVDQFHMRGRDATMRLARLAGLQKDLRVLDVGGGLGGPARMLAADFGCQVTVLDLTEEYCRVGEMLTARTGLADRVTFRHGSALAMPFPEESFELAWTQHSSMNIEDKERLYAEIHRVLNPRGKLALYEIVAGNVQPIYFPVPWAADPAINFLHSAETTRTLIKDTGFREVAWVDVSTPALESDRQWVAASSKGALPPLGIHLLLRENFIPAIKNLVKNLAEERIAVIEAIFERI